MQRLVFRSKFGLAFLFFLLLLTALEFSRNRRPIFSFVAVLLSTAATEEEDDMSSTIRNAFALRKNQPWQDCDNLSTATFSKFKIGQLIGQGCNSAVYEARYKPFEEELEMNTLYTDGFPTTLDTVLADNESFEVISESDDFEMISDKSDSEVLDTNGPADEIFGTDGPESPFTTDSEDEAFQLSSQMQNKYDLAIKMMFNYDIESNADMIYQGMMKELTPVQLSPQMKEESIWLTRNNVKLKLLPPHPNIVDMKGIFVDDVPKIDNDEHRYPAALPTRLNPNGGLGRNKTMFLVMKKYDMTLKTFLSQNEVSMEMRCCLVAQLLEGIAHMADYEVAHRDLKSDNILIDVSSGQPELVISDFGCCLSEPEYGLMIPYNTSNIDKGGNVALMPPEILLAEPGRKAWLDYRKSDLWTAGTLVYEIFGEENPFYKGPLSSKNYDENDLPTLPPNVPSLMKKLTEQLLRRNPASRPNPRVAADIAQMILMFPQWLKKSEKLPLPETVRENIVILAATKLLQPKAKKDNSSAVFLQRVEITSLLKSLAWFRNNQRRLQIGRAIRRDV